MGKPLGISRLLRKGVMEMKKLICIVLIFILALTGCSKWNVEIVDPTKPSENEENSSASEEKIIIEHADKVLDYICSGDGLDWNTNINKLASEGIKYKAENVNLDDNWYWSANLVLEKNGNELVIPIEGLHYYSEEYDVVQAPYGSFAFFEDHIVYCGKEKVIFFDSETLETRDFSPQLNKNGFDDIWVNAAVFDEESENYILLTTVLDKFDKTERKTVVNIYDKTGKLLSEKETLLDMVSPYGEEDYMFPRFSLVPGEMFHIENNSYININAVLIDIETGETFEFYEQGNYIDGEHSLRLFSYSKKESSERGFTALLYKNGEQTDAFFFEEYNMSIYYEEIDKPDIKISSNGKTAEYYSDYFAMTLELDFENKTHSLRYEPEDRHISKDYEEIKSSDKKYSLCNFGEMGGGDAWYSHIALRDNETGKYSYIGQTGGMYGGNGGYGFLKNNDVYNYSVTSLQIFDPETGKIKFDINENFPLGYSPDGKQGRGILTFRRDPEDFSYIVVYYEFDDGYSWKEVEDEKFGWREEASFNYKIGFLDAEGNLIESYDTGLPVFSNYFGYHTVEMRYSEEKLMLFFDNSGKGDSHIEGVFDMETKEFTVS